MTYKVHLFLAVLFANVFTTATLFGQDNSLPRYHFESLTYNITERAVASICQDKMGFIWMGTNGLGLSKFNGIDYKSYTFKEQDSTSLSNSLVHTTYVDSKNKLWIGTESGLDLYNREQDNFIRINLNDSSGSSAISVQAILERADGSLLIGTHQHGLFHFNPVTLKAVQVKITDVDNVQNLLINSISHFDNRILLGTNQGIFEFDSAINEVKQLQFKTIKGMKVISVPIKTMTVDRKGSIWLGTTNQGVFKVDTNENGRYEIDHYKITSKRVLALLETPRNTILCGTENDGMFEMDSKGTIVNHYLNDKFDDTDIKSNSIWSLFLDNSARIWIGYYNNGVAVYDRFYDKFPDLVSKPYTANSLQSSSVTEIIQDEKGSFWIGMDGGGIDVYNPSKNTFTHLLNTENKIANGLEAPNVQTLFKDSKGNIWVGTWDNGIYFLEKNADSFVNYSFENTNGNLLSNRVLNFTEDATGTIWIATFSGGIQSFDPKYKDFKSYSNEPFSGEKLSYSDVRKVYVDSEDNLWIASNAGLFRLVLSKNNFKLEDLTRQLYNKGEKVGYNSLVIDIYEDSAKNIWIGTASAGLYKYKMKEHTFAWVNSENDFSKVTVSSIIEDENGGIWAAGNNGITHIDTEKNSTKNFSVYDGLLANDFNNHAVYKDETGILWFGSYNGINYFNPDTLISNANAPVVYLTDLKLFNKKVEPKNGTPLDQVISQTQSISLSHDQSVFTIDYAAIDFTRPEKIQFAYYLEGFEKDWNYVENSRSATYTNLPAGNYTFKVKAANSDGFWSETPVVLNIEILRPWWLTNTAIIIYIILAAMLIYATYSFLQSRMRAKRAIEKEREQHIQEEALNDKKIQFFTNISHEFRTPLTLILSPLEDILEETGLPEKIKEKHQIIHKNTERLKRLIDELMDFRKLQLNKLPLYISAFNINVLAKDVLDHFKEEARQRNIAISFEAATKVETIWADENKLEKVIFNILSNAFKSTANNGIITLKLACRTHKFKATGALPQKALEISIEDTGKGILPEELNKIFDRFYQIKDRNDQYFNGTGIGLEVVKSFVELHLGEIAVESEIGVGTLFKILIPIEQEHPKIIEQEAISSEKQLQTGTGKQQAEFKKPEGKRKTLLIIEDNMELRNYIARELKEEYKVHIASDGEEGLKQAQKYLPDAVITDVIMPKSNGHEFCAKLKADLRTSHIPVLMLTAKSMTDDWVKGLEVGADAYLTKPFKMKVMRSQVKQLIYNRELLFSKYLGNIEKNQPETSISSVDQQFILNIMAYIQKNMSETNLNVEKLADEFDLSRSQLYRKIKALTGLTANELIRKVRLEKAKEMIQENGSLSISDVSFKVGFSSPSYFSKCFKDHFEILPTDINGKE